MKLLRNVVLILFILFVLFLSLVLYFQSPGKPSSDWESTLLQVMYLYLAFIFLRTATHLFLAFAGLFFRKRSIDLTEYPLVSVLVPCYNESKVIRTALRSVMNLSYPNFEIIAIDDGSQDPTLDELAKLHTEKAEGNGRLRVIHQKNMGKGEALNRGIQEAQGEFIFCMDADSSISWDAIEQGMSFMSDQRIAAVAGTVEVGNQRNFLAGFQSLEYISGLNLFKEAQSFLGIVTVVPGPVGLFRKSAVIDCGGYKSESLAEDCELTLRLLLQGHMTIYHASMTARTEVPEDFLPLISQRYRWSRGVLRAIKMNRIWLFHPLKNLRNFFILSYMFTESFLIPSINFLFSFATINYALLYGVNNIFGYFFGQLVVLDVILVAFCLSFESGRNYSLIFYAVINRFTYGMSLEILRFFSIIDEVLGLPLNWGKLERKGL